MALDWLPTLPDLPSRKHRPRPDTLTRGGLDPFTYAPPVALDYWESRLPAHPIRRVVARPQPQGLAWCPGQGAALTVGLEGYYRLDDRLTDTSGHARHLSWTPQSLTNMVLWRKADPTWCFKDNPPVTPAADGDTVATWTSRMSGGDSFTAVQLTAGNRPQLHLSGGVYDVRSVTNDWFDVTGTGFDGSPSGVTVFIAGTADSAPPDLATLFGFGTGPGLGIRSALGKWEATMSVGGGNATATSTTSIPTGTRFVIGLRFDSTLPSNQLNLYSGTLLIASGTHSGAMATPVGTQRLLTDAFSSVREWTGGIYELIGVARAVTDAEMTMMVQWLTNGTVPAGGSFVGPSGVRGQSISEGTPAVTGLSVPFTDLSLSFWVNFPAAGATAASHLVSEAGGATLTAACDSSTQVVTVTPLGHSAVATSALSTNVWHHIAVVCRSGVLTLYVDAVAVATGTAPSASTLTGWTVAATPDAEADEWGVWSTALSHMQVEALYLRGAAWAGPDDPAALPDNWWVEQFNPVLRRRQLNGGAVSGEEFLPTYPTQLDEWAGVAEVPTRRHRTRPTQWLYGQPISDLIAPGMVWQPEADNPARRPVRPPGSSPYVFTPDPTDWIVAEGRLVARPANRAARAEVVAPFFPAEVPLGDWFYSDPLPVVRRPVRRHQGGAVLDLAPTPLSWLGECGDSRPFLERVAPGLYSPQPWFAYPFSPPPPPPPVTVFTCTYWVAVAGPSYWIAGVGGMADHLVRNVITKSAGDARRLGMDFGDLPEFAAGATVSACTITAAPSGDLTLSGQTTESGGYRVSVVIAGGVPGEADAAGEYKLTFTATLSSGAVVSRTATLQVVP